VRGYRPDHDVPQLVSCHFGLVKVLLGLALFWSGSCCATWSRLAASESEGFLETQRPNIVLIVIDDLGYGDLGCYGSQLHRTPHIDRLAREGMRFTDFHTNGAVCSPTRVAILSGQYQQRSGIESAIGFTLDEGMPLKKLTVAEALKTVGYRCGVFGKWHVGHVSRFGPNAQGFDISFCSNNSPDYHTHVSRVGEFDWFKNHQPHRESGYLTDIITRHTLDFMARERDQPFFAFVSHAAVHFPFQGPQDPPHRTLGKLWHDEKYGPLNKNEYGRAYRDMLEAVDDSVGKIIAMIKQLGLSDQTMVLVTSDNGAYSWVGSNGHLRGEKGSLHEGGHRVPAIAWWPGHITAGAVSDSILMTMDLLPTFAAVASVDQSHQKQWDGIDASAVFLQNKSTQDRLLFWRSKTEKAVRHQNWKLLAKRDGTQAKLYHLGRDPGEQNDLSVQFPGKVNELLDALMKWEADVVEEFPAANRLDLSRDTSTFPSLNQHPSTPLIFAAMQIDASDSPPATKPHRHATDHHEVDDPFRLQ